LTSIRSAGVPRTAILAVTVCGALFAQYRGALSDVPQPDVSQSSGSGRPSEPASAPPSASAAPLDDPAAGAVDWAPKPGTTTKEGVFSGRRQSALVPTGVRGGPVAVDANLRVVAAATTDRALFVIKQSRGDRYLIQTAKLTRGSEPYCLEAQDGNFPMSLIATACNARLPTQSFTFEQRGTEGGAPRWAIRTAHNAYLQVEPQDEPDPAKTRFVAVPADTAGPATFFTLPDSGPSTLPDFN
jgi:hypothetical protein